MHALFLTLYSIKLYDTYKINEDKSMSKGIVIKGGGRNKVVGGSIVINEPNSIAIEMKNTFDNKIKNLRISLGDSVKKLEEIQENIVNIQDNSINPKTGNAYKTDALSKLPILISSNNEIGLSARNIIDLISLLGSWITIQAALTPTIAPYIGYLTTLLEIQ